MNYLYLVLTQRSAERYAVERCVEFGSSSYLIIEEAVEHEFQPKADAVLMFNLQSVLGREK